MANFNVIPFGLLGREISFKDLAFERSLSELTFPDGYPEEFKSCLVKGVVEFIDITFNTKMEMSCQIVVNDAGYCISEIDLLEITKKTD